MAPMSGDERRELDERFEKLSIQHKHDLDRVNAEARKSQTEARLEMAANVAAIMTGVAAGEERDREFERKINAKFHDVKSQMATTQLEIVRLGSDLKAVKSATAKLTSLLNHPVVRLLIQALMLIGISYASKAAAPAQIQAVPVAAPHP